MLSRSPAMIHAAMQRAGSSMRPPGARGARHRSVGHPRRPRYKCREGLLGFEDQPSGLAEEDAGPGDFLSWMRLRIQHEVSYPCRGGARRVESERPRSRLAHLRVDRRTAGPGTNAPAASAHSMRGVWARDSQAEHRGQQAVRMRWNWTAEERLPEDPALFADARHIDHGSRRALP